VARETNPESVPAAVAALDSPDGPTRELLRDAVRALLSQLAAKAPGKTVEVRVPPYGAVQCVAGPRHTRGTPPNVIETDPVTFLKLAAGRLEFAAGVRAGLVTASGTRADLSGLLPLVTEQP
jgi:hypothetical protein